MLARRAGDRERPAWLLIITRIWEFRWGVENGDGVHWRKLTNNKRTILLTRYLRIPHGTGRNSKLRLSTLQRNKVTYFRRQIRYVKIDACR